jgi:hypothetical protein
MNIVEVSRNLDVYFPSDITNIVLEFLKKALWDYQLPLPVSNFEAVGNYRSFDDYISNPLEKHFFPLTFVWLCGEASPIRDKYLSRDCLIVFGGFRRNIEVWIPMKDDDYEKAYDYLKRWFEFL